MSRYALPYVDEVTEPIPEAYRVPLEAPKRQSGQARVQQWLRAHEGQISEYLAEYVSETPQPFRGRNEMHRRTKHVVQCGAEGQEGATAALLELRELWMASPHNEADPGQEFDNSVTSNIRDYGFEKPVEFTSLMRKAGLDSGKDKPATKKEPVKGRRLTSAPGSNAAVGVRTRSLQRGYKIEAIARARFGITLGEASGISPQPLEIHTPTRILSGRLTAVEWRIGEGEMTLRAQTGSAIA